MLRSASFLRGWRLTRHHQRTNARLVQAADKSYRLGRRTCGRSLRCAGDPIITWMPRLHVRPISVCVDRVRCGKEGKDSENSFLQYCDPHSKPWRPLERRKNLGILECRYCREFSLWESLEQMTEYCEFLWNSDVSFGGKYISNEVQPHIFLFCVLEILCSSCAASSSSRCWDFLKCLFSPSFHAQVAVRIEIL